MNAFPSTTAALMLAFTGLTVTAPPADAAKPAGLAWSVCTDAELAVAGAECGSLAVPLDPSRPDGAHISLALSRLRHTAPDAQFRGTVLTVPNPLTAGGFKQSLLSARVPGGAGARYDWIGFAPRGIAPSVPRLSCSPDHFSYNRPVYEPAPATEPVWLARTQAYADACATAEHSELLAHMRATDTVADLEAVRTAVGAAQVTLFAQSYGTYTAQIYATRHPDRLAGMVLDSALDPGRVWYNAAYLDQSRPLQRNLDLWFDWLAENNAQFGLGTTRAAVRAVWDEQLAAVARTPIDGVIGKPEWQDLFLTPPFFRSVWPLLGSAFSGWVHHGDGVTVRALFDAFLQRGNDNTYAALMAQTCTDAPWPRSYPVWRADAVATDAVAPDTTWGNTWFNRPCAVWPVPAGPAAAVDGRRAPAALLLHEGLDGVAPFAGALVVRDLFPRARLVARPGSPNHIGALTGDACLDGAIADYLNSGALPTRRAGRQADHECSPAA